MRRDWNGWLDFGIEGGSEPLTRLKRVKQKLVEGQFDVFLSRNTDGRGMLG